MRKTATSTSDARTGKRFDVQLPIRIHLPDSVQEQSGTTANVSISGVYLRAGKGGGTEEPAWRPGATVEFEITLPSAAIAAEHDVRIHCRGRVVRVEQLTGEQAGNGVACVIDKYEFVRK